MQKLTGNIAHYFILTLQSFKSRSGLSRLLLSALLGLLTTYLSQGQVSTSHCSNPGLFLPGSCIIDMGRTPQTEANGLRPYGLLYELVNQSSIPVFWSINPGKSFDGTDFTVDGINFRGGPFIISSEYMGMAQPIVDFWVSQGVVVHYAVQSFTPPIYDEITYLPKVVLDAQNGNLLQASFYNKAGIPPFAYTLGGIPSIITECDDIYVMPHADPVSWSQTEKDLLYNFITGRGWFFAACHAVSDIERSFGGTPLTQMNFLSNTGLVLWGAHGNPTPPFNYNASTASEPWMQFMGTMDNALLTGSEQVYIPLTSWRPSTTIAINDPDFPLGTSSGPAAELAYGRAYGNSSNGMVMYMAGHRFDGGSEAENVAAGRVYADFWIKSGLGSRPVAIPNPANPISAVSGTTVTFSATATTSSSAITSWQWTSDCGAIFITPNASTTDVIVPSVDVLTQCYIQVRVADACNRPGYACMPLEILPSVITNNNIAASQIICTGQTPATLTGSVATGPDGFECTYSWLSSTSGPDNGFSATGVTTRDYVFSGPLALTTWFRREATSGSITVVSASIQITVRPVFTITASATPTTICLGQSTTLSSTAVGTATQTIRLANTQDYNIPNNSSTGISSIITVAGAPASMASLTSISVSVNVSHKTDQDVELYLIRPGGSISNTANGTYMNTITAGQSIALVADRGANGDNFTGTVFSDGAANPISAGTAPFTGTYRPENAFSTLNGNPNGNWTLKGVDDAAGESGKILDWTITMTFSTGVSYSWSSVPAGFTSSVEDPGLVTPSQATTYTVTLTDLLGGCTYTSSVTVTISPAPAITPMTALACSGVAFSVTPVDGINGIVPAGTTYSWPVPVVTGGMTGGATGTNAAGITGTLTNPTGLPQTATYTVTPSLGTCTGATFTVTVTVNPRPAITNMTALACSGTAFTVTPVNGTNGVVPAGTTYSWPVPVVTGGMTGGAAGAGAASITGTLINPTNINQTATYTVTPLSGTCTGANFTLTITVRPAAAITNMTASACSGTPFSVTPVNITNGVVPAGTTYSWPAPVVTGGMTGGAAGSGASITGTLFNSTGLPQTATYTVTPLSGSCTGATFTVTVTINTGPVCDITGNDNLCPRLVGNVYSAPPGMTNYLWTISGNGTVPSGVYNAQTITVTAGFICDSTFTLRLTINAGGCVSNCSKSFMVLDHSPPTWITAPNSLDRTLECTDAAGLAAAQLLSPTPTDNCFVLSRTKTSGAFVPGSCGGTYTNTWIARDRCTNTSTVFTQIITITDTQAPLISVCPAAQSFCEVAGNTYTIPSITASDNCSVTLTTTFQITGATIRNGTGNDASGIFNTGTSTIVWSVADACGNTSTCTTTVTISAPPAAPTASVTVQPTCAISTGTITVTSPANGPGISYTVTGTNPVVAPVTNATGVFAGLTPGVYDVTATNAGCLSLATSLTVNTVPGTPVAAITPDPALLCADGSLNMNGNPSGGSGTYTTHLWTGTGAAWLSNPNIQNPAFSGAPAGTYTLIYSVTDNIGCVGTDNITVTVSPLPTTSTIYHP